MNCPSDLLSLQDNYSSIKSATVARRMRRDGSSAQIDILTHVRFHSTRRCLTLEHFAISPGPRAARGKVVVEASLQPVWDACLSRSIGPSIPPNLLLVCPCLAQTRLRNRRSSSCCSSSSHVPNYITLRLPACVFHFTRCSSLSHHRTAMNSSPSVASDHIGLSVGLCVDGQ